MRSSMDRSVLEEPWAKRLRTTRSRSISAGQGQQSDHLPSPKRTNPSSSDNIPSSSSSTDRKPKATPKLQSLRERLVPLPTKLVPVSSLDSTQAANKNPSKPSVAPFFQRIEAAFQDKPVTAVKPNHTTATARKPAARSPSPDAEDLIQQLKEHYLQTATTLHMRATLRLSQTHADLARELSQSLTARDEAFLARAEAQIKTLAQPLGRFRIRAQRQRGGVDGAAPPHSEENSVGELVARAEGQVRRFEEEVRGLWAEWETAEGEVEELVRGVVACVSGAGGGDEGKGKGEGEEMLRRFREVVEREIGEAEEEVGELGEEAVGLMKEIEKDFRKATLPDLHTFFQSIDEP